MDDIIKLIKGARFVFVCGNGGSATTAEHFTNDLFSKGIKAVCLNSNTSIMTMIANDYGYKYVFSKQLDVLANEEDLLVLFSVSGESPNIIEAMDAHVPLQMIPFFGRENETYQEAENRHLNLAHKIAEKL